MLATLMIAVLIRLIPATIASNKGGPFASWWMFGTALFIIALPAALLMKPDTAAVERKQLSEGMQKCPDCAEMIRADAQVSRFCGCRFATTPPRLPAAVSR